MIRWLLAFAVVLGCPVAHAQYSGTMPAMTLMGNKTAATTQSASPMAMNALPPLGIVSPPNTTQTALQIDTVAKGAMTAPMMGNRIYFTDAGVTLTPTSGFTSAMEIVHSINGGSLSVGNASALDTHMNVNSTTACVASDCNFQGFFSQTQISANQGGTGTSIVASKGAAFGGGSFVTSLAGATNLLGVVGWEFDYACVEEAAICAGITIAPFGTHAKPGKVLDAFIDIGSTQTAGGHLAAGVKNVIFINDLHGNVPLDPILGCIICTDGASHAIKSGVDFGNYTMESYIKGINFAVGGNGVVYGTGNNTGVPPALTAGWTLQSNISNGGGEMNFINRSLVGTALGFDFRQVTGPGAATVLFTIAPGGIVVGNAVFAVNTSGGVYGSGNLQSLPPPLNTTWAIQDNFSLTGEVNFINRQAGGGGFDFRQMTGLGAATTLLTVTSTGVVFGANAAAISSVGGVYGTGNLQTYPVPLTTGWAIQDNLSNVNGEMNFINRQTTGTGGFSFIQMTGVGTGTAVALMDLSGFYLSTNANALSATKPFIYLTTSAGTPSGVPLGATAGKTACQYDSTANKLWCYSSSGGGWKSVPLT